MAEDVRGKIEELYARLETNPQDWGARERLAGLFEAAGDRLMAAGQRWQVLNRKASVDVEPFSWCSDPGSDGEAYRLDGPLFDRLLGGEPCLWNRAWRGYLTQREADEALARALFPELVREG